MKTIVEKSWLPALAFLLAVSSASATEVFQNTSVTAGYTTQSKDDPVFGTGTTDKKVTQLRFEHFGVNGIGDNYFFVDNIKGSQIGGSVAGSFGTPTDRQYVLVWNARASFSKLSGTKVELGPVSDVSLMYRMERGSYANYGANMVGPSLNLNVPGFAWFQTSFLLNKQDYLGASADAKRGHMFWHNYAILPFEAAGVKFTFAPLLWVNFSKEAGVGRETYVEPDLWAKLGETGADVGLRLQYHSYKNYHRTTPTLMLRFNL
jgi:nucleoside-specific outer membrane channel protein Tsx